MYVLHYDCSNYIDASSGILIYASTLVEAWELVLDHWSDDDDLESKLFEFSDKKWVKLDIHANTRTFMLLEQEDLNTNYRNFCSKHFGNSDKLIWSVTDIMNYIMLLSNDIGRYNADLDYGFCLMKIDCIEDFDNSRYLIMQRKCQELIGYYYSKSEVEILDVDWVSNNDIEKYGITNFTMHCGDGYELLDTDGEYYSLIFDTKEMKKLVMKWTPEIHAKLNKDVRERVLLLFMMSYYRIEGKQCIPMRESTELYNLPPELLFKVFTYCL